MLESIRAFFAFDAHRTTFRREILGGATTFLTMAYIVVVNPAILAAAGIPVGPSTVATIATAIFGTLLMGLHARRPFAVAPYMGENAFVAFTVVGRSATRGRLPSPRSSRPASSSSSSPSRGSGSGSSRPCRPRSARASRRASASS